MNIIQQAAVYIVIIVIVVMIANEFWKKLKEVGADKKFKQIVEGIKKIKGGRKIKCQDSQKMISPYQQWKVEQMKK
jgi:hypothetical protein